MHLSTRRGRDPRRRRELEGLVRRALERVRERMDYRGKMVWQGNTLYLFNGGRVYNRLFANVVRIPNLFAETRAGASPAR